MSLGIWIQMNVLHCIGYLYEYEYHLVMHMPYFEFIDPVEHMVYARAYDFIDPSTNSAVIRLCNNQ